MAKTRSGLPKHCSWNWDRHGKKRVRFRMPGFSTYLSGTPWSPAFMQAYAAAIDGVKYQKANIGAERTKPGSFNALAVSYYRSPEFMALKDSTKAVRRNMIERFRHQHGDNPVRLMERAHIKAILGSMANTPEAANNLLKVLRVMLAHAVEIEMIKANPAIGIKKYRSRGEGIHTWTEDEITTFKARHGLGTKPRLAMELLLCTAQRRGDVVTFGRQHIRGDLIALRQEKTDAPMLIPIHPDLQAALALADRANLTFLVTEYGKPFDKAGFGNWFRKQCNLAGLPQCSAHGLRKAAATRLANAGCSTDQIKAITGHKSLAEDARYTKQADQARLARQAIKMQVGAESERELSNLPTRLDKTGAK